MKTEELLHSKNTFYLAKHMSCLSFSALVFVVSTGVGFKVLCNISESQNKPKSLCMCAQEGNNKTTDCERRERAKLCRPMWCFHGAINRFGPVQPNGEAKE